jgi:hypothetical protein
MGRERPWSCSPFRWGLSAWQSIFGGRQTPASVAASDVFKDVVYEADDVYGYGTGGTSVDITQLPAPLTAQAGSFPIEVRHLRADAGCGGLPAAWAAPAAYRIFMRNVAYCGISEKPHCFVVLLPMSLCADIVRKEAGRAGWRCYSALQYSSRDKIVGGITLREIGRRWGRRFVSAALPRRRLQYCGRRASARGARSPSSRKRWHDYGLGHTSTRRGLFSAWP